MKNDNTSTRRPTQPEVVPEFDADVRCNCGEWCEATTLDGNPLVVVLACASCGRYWKVEARLTVSHLKGNALFDALSGGML